MLPPFVPPSARVPSESLPLITEFVIERGAYAPAISPPERSAEEEVASLPSIDEFLIVRSVAEQRSAEAEAPEARALSESEAPEPVLRSPDEHASGVMPAALEREEGEPTPPAQTEIILPPISPYAAEVKESTPPGARFNDEAGDAEAEAPGITKAEAWEASAVSPAVAAQQAAEVDAWEDAAEPLEPPSTSGATEAAWVAEERDAYNWDAVGTLAAGPDDARRAEEAWSGTEWEPRRKPENEQVATALVQLARRVRAGEVKVDLPRNATVEASLAAVLTALLTQTEQ